MFWTFCYFLSKDESKTLVSCEPTSPPEQKSKPIWVIFEESTKDLPEEVISQLPVDSSAQVDHYLYGTPKQE
jgi:hypothetical protein